MWKVKLLAGIGGLAMACSASASLYQIQVGGIDLTYTQSTGNLCDANGCAFVTGGTNNPASADPVDTMTFKKDGVTVLILTSFTDELSVDYSMNIGAGTPTTDGVNPLVIGGGGFVDVVDFLVGGLPGIATNISSGSVTFDNGGINALGSGFSTVFSQNLPNNPIALGADWVGFNPINWSFSSGIGSCSNGICTYSGTGELSWSTVPEPNSLLLLGLGLVAAGSIGRKRASK